MWLKKFKTIEQAILTIERELVVARNEISRLTGKPVVATPALPAPEAAEKPERDRVTTRLFGGDNVCFKSLEHRLQKDESDLVAVRAEIAKLTSNPGRPVSSQVKAGPVGSLANSPAPAPSQPARREAVVRITPPPALTKEQRVKAAFAKARGISDPHKKALAFAEANRVIRSAD
jgi:hypothetical protein